MLQIDIDAAEIDKNVRTAFHILGDVKAVLQKLNEAIEPQEHEDWISLVEGLKSVKPKEDFDPETVNPREMLRVLNRLLKDDAIIVTDVGQHQMWTAQTYEFTTPRTFVTSGGLGAMGFGLGAAVGAKTAFPQRQVVCISGDGCFHMNCAELSTMVAYNLPVVVVGHQQRRTRDGPAVAEAVLQSALLPDKPQPPDGLREAGRGLWGTGPAAYAG